MLLIMIVASTVIFWTEVSRSYKSYPKQVYAKSCHCYQNSTIVILNWLNIQFSNDNESFPWLRIYFFHSLSLSIILPRVWIWVKRRVPYKKEELHWHPSRAFGITDISVGFVLLIFLILCVLLFVLFDFVLCLVPNSACVLTLFIFFYRIVGFIELYLSRNQIKTTSPPLRLVDLIIIRNGKNQSC